MPYRDASNERQIAVVPRADYALTPFSTISPRLLKFISASVAIAVYGTIALTIAIDSELIVMLAGLLFILVVVPIVGAVVNAILTGPGRRALRNLEMESRAWSGLDWNERTAQRLDEISRRFPAVRLEAARLRADVSLRSGMVHDATWLLGEIHSSRLKIPVRDSVEIQSQRTIALALGNDLEAAFKSLLTTIELSRAYDATLPFTPRKNEPLPEDYLRGNVLFLATLCEAKSISQAAGSGLNVKQILGSADKWMVGAAAWQPFRERQLNLLRAYILANAGDDEEMRSQAMDAARPVSSHEYRGLVSNWPELRTFIAQNADVDDWA